MIKKIDWYIIKKFIGTYVFITFIIMCLSVVFDISEKIDDFIAKGAPLNDLVFKYYVNFIIYYTNRFSPLIIFISVIFFTAKMAQNTEIIPILNSGRNFYRFLRPYFIAATLLAAFSLVQNHYVIPIATKERLAFEDEFYRNTYIYANKYYSISQNENIYYHNFESKNYTIQDFRSEYWEGNELKSILYSPKISYDTLKQKWNMKFTEIRYIGDTNDIIKRTGTLDTALAYTITDFGSRNEICETMTYTELSNYVQEQRKRGETKVFAELELHQRTAFPFATYILTLIGVAVSSKKSRGGIGVHIATGLFFALVYIFSMKVSTVSATNSGVPPLIASWIPNMIFLVIGIVLFRRTQK